MKVSKLKQVATPIRAELLPLSKVMQLPRNAKDHDVEGIEASLDEFGYLQRVIINEQTGHLLSGHGRIETLQKLQAQGAVRPVGIAGTGKEWLIPVDYVNVPVEKEEAAALALNKTQENGGWKDDVLDEVLLALKDADALGGTGFSDEEIAARLEKPTLKKLTLDQPPPAMVWALIGVPMERYAAITAQIEALAELPDVIVEVSCGS